MFILRSSCNAFFLFLLLGAYLNGLWPSKFSSNMSAYTGTSDHHTIYTGRFRIFPTWWLVSYFFPPICFSSPLLLSLYVAIWSFLVRSDMFGGLMTSLSFIFPKGMAAHVLYFFCSTGLLLIHSHGFWYFWRLIKG